jgi:N6-L-threonylcarbamoyladenine synthase
MKDIILGCESSCDDTSIGILKDGKILSNIIYSQDHTKFGGVFPEFASREHLNRISDVYDQAILEAQIDKKDIDVIAATYAPGLVGSLLVGYSFAKSLSYGLNKRFVPVHHIKGHIYAAMIDNILELPAIALVISGGHTSLIYVDEHHNFEEVGYTLDDAVGEVFDKVGRAMGLSFPAGPEIDRLASLGIPDVKLPSPKVEGYNFSFSGLKSFVFRYLENNEYIKENVSASFQTIVSSSLLKKSIKAFKDFNAKSFILCGGVASNSFIRRKFREEFSSKLFYPDKKLCVDNGAMIAAAAKFMIENDRVIEDVFVKPNLSL